MSSFFPELPFDGQLFIDGFRVNWRYDLSIKCWQRMGTVPDIPIATELQPGLMSAQLKQLLDGIPEKGGHFGIIAQPLLSLRPPTTRIIIKDQIHRARRDESGTTIVGKSPINGREYAVEQFVGKILHFKSGTLKNKTFLIFTNDANNLYLDGDASIAQDLDEFEIIDPVEFNPSGVLVGDITLVSESIDITCIDKNGDPMPDDCGINVIPVDDPDNPPALDFKLNKNFLDNLCVTIPGCRGQKGDLGEQGAQGDPGTGDGPHGEQGDPGDSATEIPNTFTGIKILELDDIYDTAVVSLELDAENNRIGVVKAKVRTPGDEVPATHVLSSPISRTLKFTSDDNFDYEILMPPVGDPIDEADVSILKYPRKFDPNGADETIINKIKLSDLIDKIVEYYENKSSDTNDQYNLVLKEYVDSKDVAARTILADIADELARCEFQLPMDFCLGISPNDCNPVSGGDDSAFSKTGFIYPLASALFSVSESKIAMDLGTYTIFPKTSTITDDKTVTVLYPDIQGENSSSTLPKSGYVIQWIDGTIKSSGTDYVVGVIGTNVGLEAVYIDGTGSETVIKMPIPMATFNSKESASVELAYKEAPITEKVMAIEITSAIGGTIKLRANLPGINPQGNIKVKVLQVDLT